MVAILMLMLPYPSFITPSGLPDTIGDSQSSEELLTYVKDLRSALDRMRDILNFYFLFFVFGFFGAVYQVKKAYHNLRKRNDAEFPVD